LWTRPRFLLVLKGLIWTNENAPKNAKSVVYKVAFWLEKSDLFGTCEKKEKKNLIDTCQVSNYKTRQFVWLFHRWYNFTKFAGGRTIIEFSKLFLASQC